MSTLLACGGGKATKPSASADTTAAPAQEEPLKLPYTQLCEDAAPIIEPRQDHVAARSAWGLGTEIILSYPPVDAQPTEHHLFLNDQGRVVGIVAIFPNGLDLKPYPDLLKILSKVERTDFFLESSPKGAIESLKDASYVLQRLPEVTYSAVVSRRASPVMYIHSRVLPGYVAILAANNVSFLQRLQQSELTRYTDNQTDFPALQHFAEAEIARVGLCGEADLTRAVEQYQQALSLGFEDQRYLAEAHHRAGLVFRDKEMFQEAIAAMQRSLEIRPGIAEVHHHLGTVYQQMEERDRALDEFQMAVRLRPDYVVARFHLATAYITSDPKRAVREFETYLALAKDLLAEQDRLSRAKEHLIALQGEM